MKLKELHIKPSKIFIIITILIVILLTWSLMHSYSQTNETSAWDGVVAKGFTSGTGTKDNPYVISNASEFAYFKNLLEGVDANAYADKNYVITNSFNYGEYDISINNEIPFSGTINGNGNSIYNLKITKSLFNSIESANLKNIELYDVTYSLNNETGAILANSMLNSNIEMFILSSNVNVNAESSFGGLIYTSKDNTYKNVILNYKIDTNNDNVFKFAYTSESDDGENILINKDEYQYTKGEIDFKINTYEIDNNNIKLLDIDNMEDFSNDDYKIVINGDMFNFNNASTSLESSGDENLQNNTTLKGVRATSTISEHTSGLEGTTIYINDFTADYNYFKGLNYAEVRNTSIPDGTSSGYYDDDYLVKVQIIYDGKDINNSSLVGAVSPINNENVNKYVYYKYYALERDSNGNLATNDDGDNYIRIELIDNPFSKRPYVDSVEYGFNGWVCNQEEDTSDDLCNNAVISFNKTTYTRYMDVAISSGNEFIIHLNASWYRADVKTSSNTINNFNSMSMQSTSYTTTETVTHSASPYWKRNYTQMEFVRSYERGDDEDGYMPAASWYRTNRNSGTYTYNRYRSRCSRNTTCYVFSANRTAIVGGTQYAGGSFTFVPNFNTTGNNTETTINAYNSNYMNLLDDPNGEYSFNTQEQRTHSYIPTGGNASGFYFQVSNPTTAMIQTGEYYNSSGALCTSANSCTTAYKLIQYNDSTTKTNGNSISLIEMENNNVVDATKYYYLVTRDTNIFRYTSTTRLSMSNLEVNRPFTVTGTGVNSSSVTGILQYPSSGGWGNSYGDFTASNDIVIENIQIYGPNTQGTDNIVPGTDSKTSYVIYANSHNLKIGRNVTNSRDDSYLVAQSILGGTNSSVSGTFKVIVESGFYYAYHSGLMGGTASNTMNEITVLGNDYDRIVTSNNGKTKFLIGLDGYSGRGHHTAGSDSLFASYTIIKSGIYGYNNDGTPNDDATAGMYIGGWNGLCVNSLTGAKIEGGQISVIVGGYGYNGSATTNSTYIGMSGGTVRSIYGGAGHSTTKGNRIINVTGGTVSYSILGGSDSFESGSDDDGVVDGSTLIYVGGNTTVGGRSDTLQGVESGSVFGAGGGDTSSKKKGTVNNSHIIVNGGTINTSVYGGGNYGSTGTQSNSTSSTIIDIYGGTIGTVYGGSKSAGFSTSDYASSSTIDINVSGGTIGNIYGGSNTEGDVYGTVDMDITGGKITGNVYGGGKGSATVVTNDVAVTIGNSNGGPTIGGSVYGGSALGTVNSATAGSVDVVVVNGTIGSVYGGGEGSSSDAASVLGDITVDISGGTISNVYGGADTSGTASGNVSVNVSAGNITTNVYGGGKGSNTYVTGDVDVVIGTANVPNSPTIGGNVYGGSAFGTVNGANAGDVTVTVNNGVITGSVFGGGEGDATHTPVVLGDINVTINGGDITNVFGGNDQAGTHSKLNEVYLNGGIVDNVYGGGNKSSVTTTHVYEQGSTVTNIYGGSNTLGDVTTANVEVTSGIVQNIYGGNNEGGTCGVTNVNVDGTVKINGAVYGGGNQVDTTTTNVTLNATNGTIPNVYGGGNNASVTTSNITQNGVSVTNMFGGSNSGGTVSNSIINHNSGTTTNIYGGNNEGGNTINSTINYISGTTTNIYGGGNQANGDVSNVNVSGGTVTNVFGGGNSAGLNTSNVHITSGTIDYVYGGSNNTGLVSETNVTIDNATQKINAIYGGGNKAQVGDTNVIFNTGTVDNIYGGGNLAQANGDTLLDINGGTINSNIYGGGNYGVVRGSSTVTITNATILGSAYAGGNGETATLEGNTNITIDGNTVIGTNSSVPPASGSVFGGGNKAFTGTEDGNDSTSTVNIVSGTIYGNVYGGANTSVIYGNTIVNIGKDTVSNSSSLTSGDIYIKGHIFGGGEANASGSEIYDWFFISVTQGVHINIDANGYNNFAIDGSFYGGGNASSASGDSYLLIKNYGTVANPKHNISIQRVTYVTLDNSSVLLKGAIDRANDYDKELFSISRVVDLKLKNNSSLFLETGANLLEKFESLDSSGNKATVTIDEDNNTVTKTVDNRVYMIEGVEKNLNIAKDQQITDYGDVSGMTFFGLFNYDNDKNINTGIYNSMYNAGDILDWSGTFTRGSYVLASHLTNHDIKVDGFYSNFINEETAVNEVKYIQPTPDGADYYMWYIGENVVEYNINLVASKYSTLGSVEYAFRDFYKPNTSFQILSFDSSEIASGVTLVDRNDIPRIASNSTIANNQFGLSMEASNTGWLTTGKTSFFTSEPSMTGVTYYEGENSSVVPTMLFYLYHSKNLSEAKDLGTVRISIMAITKINALSNEIKRLVVNVNMSSALFQTTEYEGSMTPGDKYELFTSTATNITTKSKFSTFYSLYSKNENIYQSGYHRVLVSSFVLPENTKITMLDFVNGVPEYYYHIITASDVQAAQAEYDSTLNSESQECSYALSMFTKMGSRSNNSNYDDAAMNSIYYDGTDSNEEFIFIVDFSDTEMANSQLNSSLLIEMRDANNETKIGVLGIQRQQLTYNIYSNCDSQIDVTATESLNPLYIGYNDIFDVLVNYQNSAVSGVMVTDTQYFNSKLGIQIYIENSEGNMVSGTDLTGTYFLMDGVKYYPDISGITHIKLSDKVGNTEKWITFNTENSSLATGSYKFVFEAFGSSDGIYYSDGESDIFEKNITIINSTYGLKPELDQNSVIFSSNNQKNLKFSIDYTSMLDNPSIRVAMYRRKYDQIYDTNYELVDLQDYVDQSLFTTNNPKEYLIIRGPNPTNDVTFKLKNELLTGTYRLSFRLYDDDTMIGEVIRYIIVK